MALKILLTSLFQNVVLVFLPLNKVIWIFLMYVMFLLKKNLTTFTNFGAKLWFYTLHILYTTYVFQFMIKTDVTDYESEFHLGYLSAMYISFLKSS